MQKKNIRKIRRQRKIKAKFLKGIIRPRLCVFKSNKHIFAQLINDASRETIVTAKDIDLIKMNKKSGKNIKEKKSEVKKEKEELSKNIEVAFGIGKLIAERSLKKGIKKVFFDRRGYKYHGIVKRLADGARAGGLEF